MTRPPAAVVVANLGGRVYVSPQVRDPALVTTTILIPLRAVEKFPGETFRGAHVSLKKVNPDGVSSVAHSASASRARYTYRCIPASSSRRLAATTLPSSKARSEIARCSMSIAASLKAMTCRSRLSIH